ncbi:MAG: hypothetical protein QM751_00825 [Paludibacteraceae bacterium]
MKRIIFAIVIGLLALLNSCTGVKTLSKGLENESYLTFIGVPSNYREGVDVVIDDKITFKAKVNKSNTNRPKGNVYAITSGKHIITVTYKNNVIYKKQVFISSQETKEIILP